jgi:broad-specificity NMP kinase
MSKIKSQLAKIFDRYYDKRICVLGTTCCGKSTLKGHFIEAVDMDDVLWPTLSKEEELYICQKPWTKDIGKFTSSLVKERVVIKPGHPLFSLILLDCDVIIYLGISDALLQKHCQQRNASFEDAKKVKYAIENTISTRRMSENLKIYDLEMDE